MVEFAHLTYSIWETLQASKGVATFATFFMSAILHEVLFSVAFKTVKPWFFIGMLAQIPMIMVTRFFRGKRRGNFLVWLSLFMSQPLLEVCQGVKRLHVMVGLSRNRWVHLCRFSTSVPGIKITTTFSA